MYYVYKITNLVNGKIYIGKTKNVKARWQRHKSAAKTKNPHDYSYLHRAINKYSIENFSIESVAEFKTEDESLAAEVELIAKFNSTDRSIGYNITKGGDRGITGMKHTDATKAKISKANTGKKRSEEARQRIADAHRGSKRTEATKQKMRDSRKKQGPITEEAKRKISIANTGRKHTKEWKLKNALRNKGEGNSSAILTEADVIEIRKLKESGVKRGKLLQMYNTVAAGTIDNILYGQSWTYLLTSSESTQEQERD